MKTRITLLLALLGYSLFSQTCIPLDNAMWIDEVRCNVGPPYPNNQSREFTYHTTSLADTVISGMTYRKLFSDHLRQVYRGGLRADSTRVWVVPADSTTEFIAYDFNLAVGDTITNALAFRKGNLLLANLYVADSYIQDGRQTLELHPTVDSTNMQVEYDQFWTYGVGNRSGFLSYNRSPNTPAEWCSFFVACLSVNDTSIYPTEGDYQCGIWNIGTTEIEESELTIFPNPASSNLYFSGSIENGHIEIINVNGQLVERKKVDAELSIQHLPSGLYTILLYEDDLLIHREKLAINH